VNEDDMAVIEPLAGDELEQVMARYARVRLDPSPAATRRARSAVMEEAWRRRLALADAAVPQPRRRGLFAGWSMRRVGVTLAAAVMAGLLLGSTAFAGSRAGGPLYGTRLAIEEITLPGGGEARLEAEMARAQTRLAEIVDASARGDKGALTASLAAYEGVIGTLEGETGAGAQRALETIRLHRAVLVGVLANAPSAATSGLDEAISRSDALITRLESAGKDDGAGAGGDGGTAPGAGNGGGQGAQPTKEPGPRATPRAAKSPKPEVTPNPTPRAAKSPMPDVTPKPAKPTPDATPKPKPTPKAGGPDASPPSGGRQTPAP
jgi:hypothetical protein